MSKWEIAPGRLLTDSSSSNKSEPIAYSSAYLASNQSVSLTSNSGGGTTFRLLTLPPGSTTSLPAEEDKLMVCSVAQGVVLAGKEEVMEFQVGPNGMWKVDPGMAFSVVNPFHLGAAVHVTGVSEGGE
ncbi:hypothetical protein B0T16DRAFT_339219 [Cercophora newfieldiana]|uniref:Uncharacterized protein n=1 Tax=Cercophora newfieldiana TaxID=92897 RepID=A0AA39XS15_9PEZI|nr:hypothetical protein B0T16DRAFT_339219 [Cercophora newfieldiana]